MCSSPTSLLVPQTSSSSSAGKQKTSWVSRAADGCGDPGSAAWELGGGSLHSHLCCERATESIPSRVATWELHLSKNQGHHISSARRDIWNPSWLWAGPGVLFLLGFPHLWALCSPQCQSSAECPICLFSLSLKHLLMNLDISSSTATLPLTTLRTSGWLAPSSSTGGPRA